MFNLGNSTNRWPTETTIVDISHPDELRYWTQRFRVSAGMLKRTLRKVGPQFGRVVEALERKREAVTYSSSSPHYRTPSWEIVRRKDMPSAHDAPR